MDPVSIIGVAAASLQFVDFALKLFTTGWRVYMDQDGRGVELKSLSAIYDDLLRMTANIDQAVTQNKTSSSSAAKHTAHGSGNMWLENIVDATNNVAEEIKRVLPRASAHFEQVAWSGDHKDFRDAKSNVSVGGRFRMALEQTLKADEIQKLKVRLVDIRTMIFQQLTAAIWLDVQETKQWEQQLNRRFDEVMLKLAQTGQQSEGPGPLVDQSLFESIYRETAATDRFVRRTQTEKQIARRLWDDSWSSEQGLLSPDPIHMQSCLADIRAEIIETLYYDSIKHREEAIAQTFRSTYEWILSSDRVDCDSQERVRQNMSSWLRTSDEDGACLPLWITGKPGSGKSVMMKFIANHPTTENCLRLWASDGSLCKVSYYAWKPGASMGKSREGLMRSILYQALVQNPELTANVCPRHWALFQLIRAHPEKKCCVWNSRRLKESLDLLLREFERIGDKLMIFIDGLDEFVEPPVQLCEIIMDLAQSPATKLCVASRPWPQFRDAFSKCLTTEVQLVTQSDISSYVFGKFEGVPAFMDLNSGYGNGGTELIEELVDRAQGVFLWVTLVATTILESLTNGAGLRELQHLLDAMPPEIEELYDAIIDSVPASEQHHTAVMLRLSSAQAPGDEWHRFCLADELRGDTEAITLSDTQIIYADTPKSIFQRRLRARTRGILELIQDTGRVEYLHRTAAEWLQLPHVHKKLLERSPQGFNPYVSLYFATLTTAISGRNTISRPRMPAVDRALAYASNISERDVENVSIMIGHMSWFQELLQPRVLIFEATLRSCCAKGMARFVSCWYAAKPQSFMKLLSDERAFTAVLREAIFNPTTLSRSWESKVTAGLKLDHVRLELIEFLLQNTKLMLSSDIPKEVKRNEERAKAGRHETEAAYYGDVMNILQRNSSGVRARLGYLFRKL